MLDRRLGEHGLAFGPFVLERRLAVGGTAEVFLAHPKIGTAPAPRLVVKKLLPVPSDGERYNVLEREAELHRHIRHPNVVTVFGAGMVRDEPYLAMEFVEGVDLYRLLTRLDAERRRLTVPQAVYIARRVADALAAVHSATDTNGRPLGIVHRDVTPSNVYLSTSGEVKLGDFGIARVEREDRVSNPNSLKGKFAYLAPEQVAGDPFNHRADLFALVAVLGEMLIGERVFPGSGQLAVLLAIRDGNIDPLLRAADRLPQELVELCKKGLGPNPDDRFQTAAELAEALAPFEQPSPQRLSAELAELVTWALDQRELAKKIEHRVRDSVQRMLAAKSSPTPMPALRQARVLSSVTKDVSTHPLSRLIEMIATGELGPSDGVSLMGEPFRPIRDIPELARHLLPSTTAVTNRFTGPGVPDYQVLIAETPMVRVLAHLRNRRESGALFVQRTTQANGACKEIYVEHGKLHHVASSDRNELLGEYLVRRGRLSRDDLERALSSLNHTSHQLGDLLIEMGLVGAVDLFRALRDQGRDRVAALCTWNEGRATFYRGTAAPRVDFPLGLDIAHALMAGIVVAHHGDPRLALPSGATRVVPGARYRELDDPKETETAPSSLKLLCKLISQGLDVDALLAKLTEPQTSEGKAMSAREAAAALATAHELGWVALEPEG